RSKDPASLREPSKLRSSLRRTNIPAESCGGSALERVNNRASHRPLKPVKSLRRISTLSLPISIVPPSYHIQSTFPLSPNTPSTGLPSTHTSNFPGPFG